MNSRALVFLVAVVSSRAESQCADGSQPPCKAAARAVRPPADAVFRGHHFVILPFKNVTRRPDEEWLVAGAPLMLTQILGQFSDIVLVPEERLSSARRSLGLTRVDELDAAQLRRVAEATGGWTAVTGNAFATGDRLRLTVQSMDIATAKVLVRAETEIAAKGDVREAFDQLSVRVLEPTGIPSGASLASITTRSVDAFRAYARGLEQLKRSKFREAEQEFIQAVALDSTFALAWNMLASNSISTGGIQVIANPLSRTYRAIEQASRFSGRLGQRDARYIRAIHALFRGETQRAGRQLDSLLAANPEDLDVAFWVAAMQILAPSVDTMQKPLRLAASVNRTVALAAMILDRDPSRRMAHQAPVFAYALAGGLWWGDLFGHRSEFSSYAALMMTPADVREVPVPRGDSMALMPREAFDSLPVDEQQRLRHRSAELGWRWAERWLLAGPEDADAHLWASRIAELLGNFDRAEREFAIADSLGIQSAMENKEGRRLSLLVLSGRVAQAGALADSLLTAGMLTNSPFLRVFDRRRGYGVAALLLTKRWDRAGAMADAMGRPSPSEPTCASLRREMVGFDLADLPPGVRRAVSDSVVANIQAVMAVATLQPCGDDLAKRLQP